MLPVRTLLLMAVGVLAVSFSGPLMAAMVVPPLAISLWRNAGAAAVLAPGAMRRGEIRRLDRGTARLVGGAGLALAVHFGTWVTSLTLTSVASATALVCLQIAWVVAWQLLRGERYGVLAVSGLVTAFVGVLVVSGVDLSLSTRALVGDVLALLGGMAAAVYVLVGVRARQALSTTSYTFSVYGTCAAILLPACLVAGQDPVGFPAKQWALLGLVTLTSQLLGHSTFNHLLATVPAVVVSLALLLEVPGASLIAAAWLHQVPSVAAVIGLVTILVGTALVVLDGRSDTPAAAPLD